MQRESLKNQVLRGFQSFAITYYHIHRKRVTAMEQFSISQLNESRKQKIAFDLIEVSALVEIANALPLPPS